MATVVTPLRRDPTLDRVRDLVLRIAPDDGHRVIEQPDLCIYRYGAPTAVRKAATFGVTLGVVLQGTKRLTIDGHALTVDPSRLLVITRETEHESVVTMEGEGRPYLGLSLCFSPDRVARALYALAQAGGEPAAQETIPAFVTACDEHLAAALERLVRTLDDPLERKLLAPLAIDEILFRLLRSDAAAAVRSGIAHAADAGRILESMQFIRDHYTEKLTVEGLARGAAMSPSHFAHRFSAVARISPMRYVREVRLESARALLATRSRAGEVALDVGFESPAHFAREFKRRFGVSPSQYGRVTT
jgi:AraC-like DNA-binding protein